MPDKIDYKVLAQISLFHGVSADTLAQIAANCTWVTIERGATLFKQGESSQNLYIIHEGELRIVREYESELDRIVVAVLGPGQVTGELSMIIGEPRTATVEATQNSRLVRLDRDTFFNYLGQDPNMASQLLVELGSRLQKTNTLLRETALNDAQARLASMILFLAESEDGTFKTGLLTSNFRLHRLARLVGIAPDVIDEVLRAWCHEGHLGMDKRRLFLHDVDALKNLAGWE